MSKFQQKIDEIMDEFDFEKVHRVMKFLDWTWVISQSDDVPTVGELRRCARNLLKDVSSANDDYACISTGGFCAQKIGEELSLKFNVTTWNTGE